LAATALSRLHPRSRTPRSISGARTALATAQWPPSPAAPAGSRTRAGDDSRRALAADNVTLTGDREEPAVVDPRHVAQRDGRFIQPTDILFRVVEIGRRLAQHGEIEEPASSAIAVILLKIPTIQQLVTFVRLDGYWVPADLSGIPDFFSHFGPSCDRSFRSNGRDASCLRDDDSRYAPAPTQAPAPPRSRTTPPQPAAKPRATPARSMPTPARRTWARRLCAPQCRARTRSCHASDEGGNVASRMPPSPPKVLTARREASPARSQARPSSPRKPALSSPNASKWPWSTRTSPRRSILLPR